MSGTLGTESNNEEKPEIKHDEEEPKPEHIDVLKRVFGHETFRPMQWKIINSVMNQRRDNCAVMTPGYGKSLCYQFPSAYIGGITLVISPLLSLMEEQVLALKIANISACLLGSANNTISKTIYEVENKKNILVYLTPEFCTGEFGLKVLRTWYQKLSITLITIDEAHFVSTWGHEISKLYRKLVILRDIMPTVPILALTATATGKVRNDIILNLKLKKPQILISSLDRPSVYLAMNLKSLNVMTDLKIVMEQVKSQRNCFGPTIIYCLLRKQAEEISGILEDMGIKSRAYYSELSLPEKKKIHDQFVKDEIDVVVTTIAFGMWIDKPDVRNVIHYGIPGSINQYYQEAGLAGRDGLPAKCTIFYNNTDFSSHLERWLPDQKDRKLYDLQIIKEYVHTRNCRRQFILNYFGENTYLTKRPFCCDNCLIKTMNLNNEIYEGVDAAGNYDFTTDAKKFLEAIKALKGFYSIDTYIGFLRGSKVEKIERFLSNQFHGVGKDKSEIWWKEIARLLIKFKYAVEVSSSFNSSTSTVTITPAGEQFLNDERKCLKDSLTLEMQTCFKKNANIWISSHQSTSPAKVQELLEKKEKVKLFNMLQTERLNLARCENCMPYMIASNKALMGMAQKKPVTLKAMEDCQFDGFTAAKLARYGDAFIKVISKKINDKTDQQKKTIQEILTLHPMPEMPKLGPSAVKSFLLLKSGKSVDEIAVIRGFVVGTVMGHLCDCIKFGYAVKLSQLDIKEEDIVTIIKVTKKVGMVLFNIKTACPDHITSNQIEAVVSYLRVRTHLKMLEIPYEDFEDCDYYQHFLNSNETLKTETCSKGEDENSKELNEYEKLPRLIKSFEECKETCSGGEKDEPFTSKTIKVDSGREMSHTVSNIDTDEDEPSIKRFKIDGYPALS
nr:Werner syndrome ATP-dependent helicase-like [Leptinotarsa decemlineata]